VRLTRAIQSKLGEVGRGNEADQLLAVTARYFSGVVTRILFAKIAVTAVTMQLVTTPLENLNQSSQTPTHFASAATRLDIPDMPKTAQWSAAAASTHHKHTHTHTDRGNDLTVHGRPCKSQRTCSVKKKELWDSEDRYTFMFYMGQVFVTFQATIHGSKQLFTNQNP
jgi:hypothetical protein